MYTGAWGVEGGTQAGIQAAAGDRVGCGTTGAGVDEGPFGTGPVTP